MISKIFSASVVGIDAYTVEIEVNNVNLSSNSASEGYISIVGLPDMAIRESRDRVRSAILSSGFKIPKGNIVINLAPADLKKEGAAFDLSIALGILGTANCFPVERLANIAAIGELALDGKVRPVRGVLPVAVKLASENSINSLLVPNENVEEAALAAGDKLSVYPINTLLEAVEFLIGQKSITSYKTSLAQYVQSIDSGIINDLADVKGQSMAKRAIEIAAAGSHNLLMIGPPGTGKTLISSCLPSILPPMTLEETLDTSRIHSVLGLLEQGRPLINKRPFVAPHHTASDVGLIGGGKDPRPGDISKAHNGVLFLDEFPEFKRNVLESLRQPLEAGVVSISRANGNCTFPARFILVAAMNPCPCGRGEVELGCSCRPLEKQRYRKKISGPLLDRIDLHVQVPLLSHEELLKMPKGESSKVVRERIILARAIQTERFKNSPTTCNGHMTSGELNKYCIVSPKSENLLKMACQRFNLSPRGYSRLLKVARTIADLKSSEIISEEHIFEAINYRNNN